MSYVLICPVCIYVLSAYLFRVYNAYVLYTWFGNRNRFRRSKNEKVDQEDQWTRKTNRPRRPEGGGGSADVEG